MTTHISTSACVGTGAKVSDNAWVIDNTRVIDNALVYGDAIVYGDALVGGNGDIQSTRHVLTVGPLGSEDRTVTVHRHYDGPESTRWGHRVNAGCWSGTLDKLDARIHSESEHEWDPDGDIARWVADYEGFIALARARVAEWEAEPLTADGHTRWAEHPGRMSGVTQ